MSRARAGAGEPARILVLGAGIIGSVYAGALLRAGHHVVLLVRGRRLTELRTHGLILENSEAGQRVGLPVSAVENPDADQRYDLVLIAVRAEQLEATLPVLAGMNDDSDVLFFGNVAGHAPALIQALGQRAVFGFPAVGGIRDGNVIRYGLIDQQKTTLGEPTAAMSSRGRRLQTLFNDAGFPTTTPPTSKAGCSGTRRSSCRWHSPSTASTPTRVDWLATRRRCD